MTDSDKTVERDIHPKTEGDSGVFALDQILGGKYKIISLMGRGGMGAVYRVQQVFLKTEFALKTLDRCGAPDDVQRKRFELEARAAHLLNHPNLVKVHDFGLLDNGRPYLVMELVEGVTLAAQIKEHGALSLSEAGSLFVQVCLGLAYAHEQSVVHRDIKPSNIMLVNGLPLGTEGSVKIVDFGIAKVGSHEGGEIQALTRTGEVFGSPLYMSPEQSYGRPVDHRADIYSLGCTLFEALTGTPPHVGENAIRTMMLHQTETAPLLREASMGTEFPKALDKVVQKMLAKEPSDRYKDLSVVARDLSSVCTNGELLNKLTSSRKVIKNTTKEISMTSWQLVLLLVLIVVATAIFFPLLSRLLPREPVASAPVAATIQVKKSSDDADDITAGLEKYAHVGESEFLRCQASFKAALPIKSNIFVKNGVKWKTLIFPDQPIGVVRYPGLTERLLARGTVDVPAAAPLTLYVDGREFPGPLEIPSIFARIDPKEFSELIISSRGPASIADGPPAAVPQTEGLAQILKTVAGWPNLESLSLFSLPENEESLAAMNGMKHLRKLLLAGPQLDPVELAKQPFLAQLEEACFCDLKGIDDTIRVLSRSPHPRKLFIERTSVSPAALSELRHCPHLVYLRLEEEPNDDLLQAVTQLKSLTDIFIKKTPLTPRQIGFLTQCPGLRTITLSKQSEEPYQPAVSNLQRADRRIVLDPDP